MFPFQKNLAENETNRPVFLSVESPSPKTESTEKTPKNPTKKNPDLSEYAQTRADRAIAESMNCTADEKRANKILREIEGGKSHEIPAELKKMTRAEIRNLERKNPEQLLKTCFWKIEENNELTPIENSGELKIGDRVRFSIDEASGKNKNLEMGVGLRVLPSAIKTVEIDGEKFFRISDGGPFVDRNGDYRAVRSHENETITLTETHADHQKTIENLRKTRGREYHSADAANLLSELAKNADLDSPEFTASLEKARTENPQLADFLNISEEDHARLNLKVGEASPSVRNNNPGNLKFIGQAGAFSADERGFARFMTLEAGLLAHKNQIRIDANRKNANGEPRFTVLEFTQKYLGMKPGGAVTKTAEGDAMKYARDLSENTNMKLKDLLTERGIDAIQKTMQKHEGWWIKSTNLQNLKA